MNEKQMSEYKNVLTEVIKKQIAILGHDIALSKARNVPGMKIDNEGNVTELTDDPQLVMQSLIDQFVQLSGLIVRKTMEPFLTNYPNFSMNIPSGGQTEKDNNVISK